MYEKLKSFLLDDATYTAILLLFVSIISFGLGRQSVVTTTELSQSAGVVFTDISVETGSVPIQTDTGAQQVVASKSGTKYHLLNCPGANQMKEENKVFFATAALAQAAGYEAAANCPGL